MSISINTKLVQSGPAATDSSGAVSAPIYQTATFDVCSGSGYDYSRSGNPTRTVLEEQLAALDGAKRSLAYTSGIAAVDAVLSLVPGGGRLVVADDIYGGTQRLLDLHKRQRNISVSTFKTGDLLALDESLQLRADLVLIEVPSNPYLQWTNVDEAALVCQSHAVKMAVDYSMLSPVLLRPLELGADVAIQSATKYLGGHGDLTAGVVSTNDCEVADKLAYAQNAQGTASAPFESWLLMRGLKTLDVRLERQISNATAIYEYLQSHEACKRIYVAPVPSDDTKVCPVISVELESQRAVDVLLKETMLFSTTVSFGSVSSSVSAPRSMSHACLESLEGAAQIDHRLVRLSIGIEGVEDLIKDLGRCFESVRNAISESVLV